MAAKAAALAKREAEAKEREKQIILAKERKEMFDQMNKAKVGEGSTVVYYYSIINNINNY